MLSAGGRAVTKQPQTRAHAIASVASPAAAPAVNSFAGGAEWNQKWAAFAAAFTDILIEIHSDDRWPSAHEERRSDRSIDRHVFPEVSPNYLTRSFQ